MSLRNILFLSLIVLMLLVSVPVYFFGTEGIRRSVVEEVQDRVNTALDQVWTIFDAKMQEQAKDFERWTDGLTLDDPSLGKKLLRARRAAGLTILNVCDIAGRPVAGSYPDLDATVPISRDPILRRALAGHSARGVLRLSPGRLSAEGGEALRASMTTLAPDGTIATKDALFWWFAEPLVGVDGQVRGLRYGGLALNGNEELVDSLRAMAFGARRYDGRPRGTVTLFLDTTRVATNVLGAGGTRALGTQVSKEVADAVLAQGETWRDRAWVVDTWYRSSYRPLTSPDGEIIGMLYVGLLETPFTDQENSMVRLFLLGMSLVLLLGLVGNLILVNGITRPLSEITERSLDMARGVSPPRPPSGSRLREVDQLERAFLEMQQAIDDRDEALRVRARSLEKANGDYMDMLGFVTHELKAPMATVQMMVTTLLDGYIGEVPETMREPLTRIRTNCEGLQDMVKNYLDLSRVERGELTARPVSLDLPPEVLAVCVSQTATLFANRGIHLEISAPQTLTMNADPDLLRIAVSNYLSNAAKYGQEGGNARLEAATEGDTVVISVWNEGPGFTDVERERLFGKFSRLNNATTRAMRGSGVGLFLVKQIASLHHGTVDASSKAGSWARFELRLPLNYL